MPRLPILAVLAALWALPAFAQTGGEIETTPLAPPAPRLPGGETVAPGETGRSLPGALVPGGDGLTRTDPESEETIDTAALPDDQPDGSAETEGSDSGEETEEEDALFKSAPFATIGGYLVDGPQQPDPIDSVARAPAPGAVLRQLDKLTGTTRTFEMEAGSEVLSDRLRIALTSCRAPRGGSSGGHIAFLRIWDTKNADAAPVFSGWMFNDSPALSAMDHQRYDLWVIACTTASGGASTGNE